MLIRFIQQLEKIIEKFIFLSRWVQLPVYVGLIVASVLYAFIFCKELFHLIFEIGHISENTLLLSVLGLVDVSMVINLLIIVTIGGYTTFVSKIDFKGEEDKPDWLDKVNANTLKLKLVVALVSISGVHLLKSFINVTNIDSKEVIFQMSIHGLFLLSAVLLALADKISESSHQVKTRNQ